MDKSIAEAPLPSGAFAQIRRRSFFDQLRLETMLQDKALWQTIPNADLLGESSKRIALTAHLLAKIDGEFLTLQQALDMDGRDGEALIGLIMKHIYGPVQPPRP